MAIFPAHFKEGWPSGLRHTPGTRAYVKAYRGFESLLFRHLFLVHPSLTHDRTLKIPSIRGWFGMGLLTAEWLASAEIASLGPIFSEPHDWPKLVRDYNQLICIGLFCQGTVDSVRSGGLECKLASNNSGTQRRTTPEQELTTWSVETDETARIKTTTPGGYLGSAVFVLRCDFLFFVIVTNRPLRVLACPAGRRT